MDSVLGQSGPAVRNAKVRGVFTSGLPQLSAFNFTAAAPNSYRSQPAAACSRRTEERLY